MSDTTSKAKAQIAEIQRQIDSGILTGADAADAREEIGSIGMMAVLEDLLSDEEKTTPPTMTVAGSPLGREAVREAGEGRAAEGSD
jgi:hypothetical protein